MIDFCLKQGCEMFSVSAGRCSLPHYLREFRVITSLLFIGLKTKQFFDGLLLLGRA